MRLRIGSWELPTALIVFLVTSVVYGLAAWERLPQASAQFHFVDLAHSWLEGRLDTETPKLKPDRVPEDAPRGRAKAIRRAIDSGGWNDWASLRTLTLKDGTVLRGRFPWPKAEGDKKHLFHTVDRKEIKVVVPKDLARTCGAKARSRCDEKDWYISFPPFPGVVFLPLALIWGYETNDVLVTCLAGGLAATLLFLFLRLLARRGHSLRDEEDDLWLTALYAFGSVAFFSSVRGEVWFTALVFGICLNVAFMMAALDTRRPLAAGIFLALGMATRTPIAFAAMFFAWQLFFPGNRWAGGRWPEILKKGTAFALPILAVGGLLIAWNLARFDSPFEFGHSYLSGGAAKRIRAHGLFNTHFLNLNLQAALVNVPRVVDHAPWVRIGNHGLGLLFTTPALFLLLRPSKYPPIRRAFWLAVAAAALPGLLYQNTGWKQFGYRFALDYMPYLVALLALGDRPLTRRVKAVIVFGIVVNLFGAITFGRFPQFYYG